jgi:hypothetical protein
MAMTCSLSGALKLLGFLWFYRPGRGPDVGFTGGQGLEAGA